MIKEREVLDAINHVLGCMDRKGLDNVSEESRKAYDALYALAEGLDGSPDDGSMIVFYIP
jgi:hypothetical protein